MTIRDVKTDVEKVVTLLESRTAKEQKLEQLIDSMGGLETIIKVQYITSSTSMLCLPL